MRQLQVSVDIIGKLASNKVQYRPDDLLAFTEAMVSGDDSAVVNIEVNEIDIDKIEELIGYE